MAENIEEIAALIKSIKLDNEVNNEDIAKVLNDIRNRISNLQDNNDLAEITAIIQQTVNSKAMLDNDKMLEISEALSQLKSKVDSSADIAELTEQVQTLADNFRSGFNSVVTFANKDAEAKNLLLDRMNDLETAVKNGAMVETLRQRTDELVKGYENFISDSNLRHGNMVSTIVDLKNKLDDYTAKNNYTFGTIDHSIADTNNKITTLESTVSSSLGNVNSKLYSMGDDIQKILNDGFDHLKYLSSNISEAMNSSSLDVKTTLEVLKANISDFSQNMKEELENLNTEFTNKIDANSNSDTQIGNEIITNVKELGQLVISQNTAGENLLTEKVNNVLEFITTLQGTLSTISSENKKELNDKLSELSNGLQEFNAGYEKLIQETNNEINSVSETISRTSQEILSKLETTDSEKLQELKDELLTSSSSNLNAITEKIQNITDTVDSYKNSTAEHLTSYLTTIKDLFIEFSGKFEAAQDNSEVLEKLANLEVLINKNNIERIESLINEQNVSKEEKLSNIEVLLSRIDIEKNENFAQLQSIISKNAEAIEALNVRTGSLRGLEKIENLITEDKTSKDEKLSNLEILLSRIDIEKNENFNQLQSMLNENAQAIASLKDESQQAFFTERLENLINERSNSKDEKLDNLKNLVDSYKGILDKLSEDILAKSEKSLSDLAELKTTANDILPKQSAINDLSALVDNRIFDCKNSLTDEIAAVKTSISAITEGINTLTEAQNHSEVLSQLNNLNNQLTEISQNYEQALSILGARLEEYVDSSERITSITNSKLDESSNGITTLQAKFDNLSEQINTLIGNSGLIEILANIRQQFNVVKEQIQNERNGIVEVIGNSLSENVNNICSNLALLRQDIENKQGKQAEHIASGLNSVSTELKQVLSGIENTINEKLEIVTSGFKPFEDAVKDFISLNLNTTTNEIKQQVELSYVNLRSDLGELINNNETFLNIENAYQVAVKKLTLLEEGFNRLNEDNINSISNTLISIHNLTENNFSILEDIQTTFHAEINALEAKILENRNVITDSFIQELTNLKETLNKNSGMDCEQLRNTLQTVLDNEELVDVIRGTNKVLADKLYELKQDNELAAQDIIDVANSVNNTTNYILDLINEKFENSDNNSAKILENINTLNDKLDIVVMASNNSETKSEIAAINEQLSDIQNKLGTGSPLSSDIQLLMSKFDIIAASLDDDIVSMDLEEIKDTLETITENIKNILQYQEIINLLNQKIDLLIQEDDNNVIEYIEPIKDAIFILQKDLSSTETKIENYLRAMDSTLDVLSSSHEDNQKMFIEIEDVKQNINMLRDIVNTLDNKFDIIAQSSNDEILSEIEELKSVVSTDITLKNNSKLEELINQLNNKVDILAEASDDDIIAGIDELKSTLINTNNDKNFEELKEQIINTEASLEDFSRNVDYKLDEISQFTSVNEKLDNIKSDVKESLKLEDLINQLNNKVDILAMSDDSDVIDEIYGIRKLIEEQLETLQSSVEDSKNVQSLMEALNKIDSNITDIDLSKHTSELKEAVISAIVTVTNEISFIEEADEIKDFVNEKTNELHRLLLDVKHQLHTITNTPEDMDMYSYTLQDVESDIAKLRLVVNDFAEKNANTELVVISTNLNKMARAMDDLRNAIIDVEIKRAAKNDINEINDQVISISSRLNQYILSRRDFDTQIIEKLNLLFNSDNKVVTDNIEKELTETNQKLDYTTNVITVLKNVMMYLGEWMDATTETLTSIYNKTGKISENQNVSEQLSDKSDILDLIESKFKQQESDMENLQNIVENNTTQNDLKIDELQTIIENRILKQEDRLDRIEKTLDRMASILEASGSQIETRERIEKIEEKLARLDANIEKLAAYVE